MNATRWTFESDKNIQSVGEPHPVQNWVFPIGAWQDGYFRSLGTCFQIAGEIFATAAHVFREAVRDLPDSGEFTKKLPVAIFVIVTIVDDSSDPVRYVLAQVGHTVISNNCDVAIFCLKERPLDPATGKPADIVTAPIWLGVPPVGEQCAAFGYHSGVWSFADGVHNLTHDFSITIGDIEEIYVPRRDSVMLSFPCFKTNARFNPGMSGGPVIGPRGKVIGLVCSSYEVAPNEQEISYVTLISMAMMMKFPTSRKGLEQKFLFEFFPLDNDVFEIDRATTVIEVGEKAARIGILNQEEGALHVFEYEK